MVIPEIVQAGHPALGQRAAPVTPEQITTPEFQDLIDAMIVSMRNAPGVGLAAPQLGISLRVIVLEDTPYATSKLTSDERFERGREPFALRVFINPVLHQLSPEHGVFYEGCLSIKGYAALVARSLEVEVSGLDRSAQPLRWRVSGWPARILQHEVDHLDGRLYVARMVAASFTTQANLQTYWAERTTAELKRTFQE